MITLLGAGGLLLTQVACTQKPLLTLDGNAPLVIGHRGLPGLYPEETMPSYQGAADAGADSLEEDLHLTKDCVLVARHNPWLSDNTNISDDFAELTSSAAPASFGAGPPEGTSAARSSRRQVWPRP